MTHRTKSLRTRHTGGPDVGRTKKVISKRVITAMAKADEALSALKIKHTLIGSLAVGAHGYPRLTDEVHFLVDESAFEHHGLIVTTRQGVPLSVGGVTIDCVSLGPSERKTLGRFLRTTEPGDVMPIEGLFFMKLHAGRSQDTADLVGILKGAMVDRKKVYAFIKTHSPHLLKPLAAVFSAADEE